MITLLNTLNHYLWIADATALLIFAAIAFKSRHNSSSLMTQTIVVLISGLVLQYKDLVNSFIDPATDQSSFMLWSIGFVMADGLLAFLFYRIYQRLKPIHHGKPATAFALVAIALSIGLIYQQYGPLWFELAGPGYKVWQITAYYFGIAFLFFFAIYALYQVHQLTSMAYTLIARMYMLAFIIAGAMQLTRFAEKYFWQSNQLQSAYQLGLASINICTTTVVMLISMMAIIQFYNQKARPGLLWKL